MRMNKRGEIRFKQRWCKSLKRSKFKKPKFLKSLFPSRVPASSIYHRFLMSHSVSAVQRKVEATAPQNFEVMDATAACSSTMTDASSHDLSEHQTVDSMSDTAQSTSEQNCTSGHNLASVQDVVPNNHTAQEDVVDDIENINPQNLSAADSNMPESLGELQYQLETEVKFPYNAELDTPMSYTSLENSLADNRGDLLYNQTEVPVVQPLQARATAGSDSGIMSRLDSQEIESFCLSEASGQEALQETTSNLLISAAPATSDNVEDSGLEIEAPQTELPPGASAFSELHKGAFREGAVEEGRGDTSSNNHDGLRFDSDVVEHGSNINNPWSAEPQRCTESQVSIGMAVSSEQSTGEINDISSDSPTDTQPPEVANVATQTIAEAPLGNSAPSEQVMAERPDASLINDNVLQVPPNDAGGNGENRPPARIEEETGPEDTVLHSEEDVMIPRPLAVLGPYNFNLPDIDIRQTRRMLRRMRKCATCFRRPRAGINLPCRHLANCRECSPHMRKCSICYANIACIAYCHF